MCWFVVWSCRHRVKCHDWQLRLARDWSSTRTWRHLDLYLQRTSQAQDGSSCIQDILASFCAVRGSGDMSWPGSKHQVCPRCWTSSSCCSSDRFSSSLNFLDARQPELLWAWDVSTLLLKRHDWSWSEDTVSHWQTNPSTASTPARHPPPPPPPPRQHTLEDTQTMIHTYH